jgi:hypothetical protein
MIRWGHLVRGAASLAALSTGALLMSSALLKATDLDAFRRVLEAHGVVPTVLLSVAPGAISAVEFALGVGAVAIAQNRSRVGSALLLPSAWFLLMAAYGLLLHLHPPPKPATCGCGFSNAVVRDWSVIVIRNGAYAGALAAVALWTQRMPGRPAEEGREDPR